MSNIRRAKKAKANQIDFDLHVISNTPNEIKAEILRSFYMGVVQNTLGYMDALDTRTNTVRPILVGIEAGTETTAPSIYPLAFLMNEDDVPFLQTPDGQGNFVGIAGLPVSH